MAGIRAFLSFGLIVLAFFSFKLNGGGAESTSTANPKGMKVRFELVPGVYPDVSAIAEDLDGSVWVATKYSVLWYPHGAVSEGEKVLAPRRQSE